MTGCTSPAVAEMLATLTCGASMYRYPQTAGASTSTSLLTLGHMLEQHGHGHSSRQTCHCRHPAAASAATQAGASWHVACRQ